MTVVISEIRREAGFSFAEAQLRCDFCDATSEPQSACGGHCRGDAADGAKAHAKVFQKWTTTTVPIKEGRKRYALLRDKCAACTSQNVAQVA